jgi:hypothetical protein
MKFLDCPLKYTGQTARTFKTTYKQHIQANYGHNHILNTGHTYRSITVIMVIIKQGKKANTRTHYKNTTFMKL